MLVPPDMIGPQSKLMFQVNKFYGDSVHLRKYNIAKTIREICKVVQDVLKEVEVQEPRFISSLTDVNGRYEGLDVVSPNEFEVVLYLNQVDLRPSIYLFNCVKPILSFTISMIFYGLS